MLWWFVGEEILPRCGHWAVIQMSTFLGSVICEFISLDFQLFVFSSFRLLPPSSRYYLSSFRITVVALEMTRSCDFFVSISI